LAVAHGIGEQQRLDGVLRATGVGAVALLLQPAATPSTASRASANATIITISRSPCANFIETSLLHPITRI